MKNIQKDMEMKEFDKFVKDNFALDTKESKVEELPVTEEELSLHMQLDYKQAIEKDSDYALAYAAIAESYTMLSTGFDILPSKEAMPRAREAAQKALELDATLVEASVSLGRVALSYDWDRKAAKTYCQKALELNPNTASAPQWIDV